MSASAHLEPGVTTTAPSPERVYLVRAFGRVDPVAVGVAMGAVGGAGGAGATAVLLLRGGPLVGLHLQRLGFYFPGYNVSWGGALVGLVEGALWAAAGGYVLGMLFSRVDSPWILRRATSAATDADDAPGRSVTLLPPLPMALIYNRVVRLRLQHRD